MGIKGCQDGVCSWLFQLWPSSSISHKISLDFRIHNIRVAWGDFLRRLWLIQSFWTAVTAILWYWVLAHWRSNPLKSSYHKIILSCNLEHVLLSASQICLPREVCIIHNITAKRISLVTYFLIFSTIDFSASANCAHMKFLPIAFRWMAYKSRCFLKMLLWINSGQVTALLYHFKLV